MTLDAIAPWYGCKRQMADIICAELGQPAALWDLFCGSCAIPLAMPAQPRQVVVNDLHGDLVNLLKVVADDEAAPMLFDRLARTAFSEQLYRQAIAFLHTDDRPGQTFNRAYWYFIVAWQGRNGLIGTQGEAKTGFCKRMTSNGGDPATRFRNAVERIPEWWARMRGWTILSEDGIALAGRIEDKAGTVIYADPPYLVKTARYRWDFAGNDPLSPDPLIRQYGDHGRLAAALNRFTKTRVVVSYYEHPALAEIYPAGRWRRRSVAVKKNLTAAAGDETAPEVLLVNDASGAAAD